MLALGSKNLNLLSSLCSLWLSGIHCAWFTLAAMQWLPRKVCIWKAKSRAVQPAGIVLISPFGVKTKISLSEEVELDGIEEVHGIRLRIVQNLLDGAEPVVQLVLIFCIFTFVSFLVFPVGSKPLSATSSIRSERICTSIHFPAYSSG